MSRALVAVALVGVLSGVGCGESESPSIGKLVEQLNDADHQICMRAIEQIAALENPPAVLAPLLAYRLSGDVRPGYEERGLSIINTLGHMGPVAAPVGPKIVEWCGRRGPNSWKPGIDALHQIYPDHANVISVINRHRRHHEAALLLLKHFVPATGRELEVLHRGLRHESAAIRNACCRALGRFNEQAKVCEPELVQLIADESADVRAQAIHLSARFDKSPPNGQGTLRSSLHYNSRQRPSPRTLAAVRAALRDEDFKVRMAAAYALRNTTPADQKLAIPVLEEGLSHPETRRMAISGLRSIGPLAVSTVPSLREVILADTENADHTWVKSDAAHALLRIAPHEMAVPIYQKAIERQSVYLGTIYTCLGRCGAVPEAVEILIDAATKETASDDYCYLREKALTAMGNLRPPNRRVTDLLIETALGEDRRYGLAAIRAVACVGNYDERVRPTLLEYQLADGPGHVPDVLTSLIDLGLDQACVDRLVEEIAKKDDTADIDTALRLLSHAGQLAEPALPGLVELVNDEDEFVCSRALRTLVALGPVAKPAIPAIAERMYSYNDYFQGSPAWALSEMGPAALPTLVEHFQRWEGRKAKWDAAFALKQMGPRAAPAVPDLVRLLDARNEDRNAKIIFILHAIGPAAAQAAPKLAELRTGRGWGRGLDHSIDRAFAVIGPPALPHVIPLLWAEEKSDRYKAAQVLREMGPPATAALPQLLLVLEDEYEWARFSAARAICEIGGDPSPAFDVLKQMLAHQKTSWQQRAIESMGHAIQRDSSGWIRAKLVEAMEHPSVYVQLAAVRGLINSGGKDAMANVPTLAKLIDHKAFSYRYEIDELVVQLLGERETDGSQTDEDDATAQQPTTLYRSSHSRSRCMHRRLPRRSLPHRCPIGSSPRHVRIRGCRS